MTLLVFMRACVSPVRVDDRRHVDVQVVHDPLISLVVLDQLVDDVQDGGRADPFPGVDPAIDPHGGLLRSVGTGTTCKGGTMMV